MLSDPFKHTHLLDLTSFSSTGDIFGGFQYLGSILFYWNRSLFWLLSFVLN